MTLVASAFLTYLWHYMTARLLYDEMARPLLHGRVSTVGALAAVAAAGFVLGRVSRRRRA
jgi:hypothetical protein